MHDNTEKIYKKNVRTINLLKVSRWRQSDKLKTDFLEAVA